MELSSRVIAQLDRLTGAPIIVKIKRAVEPNPIYGYVLQHSEKWLLLHQVIDFHLDDYTLIRLRDVAHINTRRHTYQRLLDKEGVSQRAGMDFQIDVSNEQSILRGIKQLGCLVIAEFEYSNEGLYLGKPLRMGRKSCSFRALDCAAVWDDLPVNVKYEKISMFRFGGEYCRVYEKYAHEEGERKPRPKPLKTGTTKKMKKGSPEGAATQ